jgi:hypothetical protein
MKIEQAITAIRNYHDYVVPEVNQKCQKKILRHMKREADIPDWTIGEIAYSCQMEKSSVSARRYAMIANGVIEIGLPRKCKISGKTCQTVKLPEFLR